MNTKITMNWIQAKSIEGLDSLGPVFTTKGGVYLWVYRGTPERVYYVGLTNSNFKNRFIQHIGNQLSGSYKTFDLNVTLDSALDFLKVAELFVNPTDTMTARILKSQNMKLLEMSDFYFATPEISEPIQIEKPDKFLNEMMEGHITRICIESYEGARLDKVSKNKYKFMNGHIKGSLYDKHFKYLEDHKIVIDHQGLPESLQYIHGLNK